MNGMRRVANPEQVLQNLGQGTYGRQVERLDYTYYDTAILAAATLQHRLFTQGLGGSTNKTLDITNMPTSGQMPQGQHLSVRSVKVQYMGSAAKGTAFLTDLALAIARSTVEFIIPGKSDLGVWTLQEVIGYKLGISIVPTVAGDNIAYPALNCYAGEYKLRVPIVLASQTPFEVRITHQTAVAATLANDRLQIGLNGVLLRAS